MDVGQWLSCNIFFLLFIYSLFLLKKYMMAAYGEVLRYNNSSSSHFYVTMLHCCTIIKIIILIIPKQTDNRIFMNAEENHRGNRIHCVKLLDLSKHLSNTQFHHCDVFSFFQLTIHSNPPLCIDFLIFLIFYFSVRHNF